jgi:hypothetical protein
VVEPGPSRDLEDRLGLAPGAKTLEQAVAELGVGTGNDEAACGGVAGG